MHTLMQLEREALDLPAPQREQFALAMCNSLENQNQFDPEGIQVALVHDNEIENGKVNPIGRDEFHARKNSHIQAW